MQRNKLLIAGLAITLMVGLVSGALIQYFGRVIMTTTVTQAVLLDGKGFDEMPILEDANVVGGESFCRPHCLESKTSVPMELQFVTTFSPELDEDEIKVTYCVETTDDGGVFGSADNEVVGIPVSLTLDEVFAGDGLQYMFTVLDGGTSNGAAPIIAVLTLGDGRHVVLFPGWETRTEGTTYTLQFGDTVAQVTPYTSNYYVDFVVYPHDFSYQAWSNGPSYPAWTATKALSGCPVVGSEVVTRIAVQHQAANTGQKDSLDSLSYAGESYGFTIAEATAFTLPPGATLNFCICYSFDLLIASGTYYIYSTVKPAP